jgi:uncharacterized protein (DUF2236 family)
VNRELLVGLGAGRAVLLEFAHPLVAAGVAAHSDFYHHPVARLFRTMQVMNFLTFGTKEEAHHALRHFQQCHHEVKGSLAQAEGIFPAGTKYFAQNPALKFWVLATLIDSALWAYEQFIAPLTLTEKRAYYLDSQKLARVFGIPFSFVPDTYEEFAAYMQNMCDGDTLYVGETARVLVQSILAQRSLHGLTRLLYFVGMASLPDKLRQVYGGAWHERQTTKLESSAQFCRRIRAWLPDFMCVNPKALLAEWRLQPTISLALHKSRPLSG